MEQYQQHRISCRNTDHDSADRSAAMKENIVALVGALIIAALLTTYGAAHTQRIGDKMWAAMDYEIKQGEPAK